MTPDGQHEHGAYTARARRADAPGVVVLHSWYGLTDAVRRTCDELAAVGYTAVAPDLYGGRTAADDVRARELRQVLDDAAALAGARRGLALLRAACGAGPLGVVGFSMGGEFALELACDGPEDVAAVVTFYGLRVTGGIDRLAAPVQAHLAGTDPFVTPAEVEEFDEAMRRVAATCELHAYPGTGHAFADASRPSYDGAAATLAWHRAYRLLGATLG